MPVYPSTERTILKELGAFLRDRRGRLKPEDVGLAPGARRRTPGLRREEVAQLAGVGVTWYTWLEQGRDIQASDLVLSALCRALRLDGAERVHVFRLAGRDVVEPAYEDGLTPADLRVLERWEPYPAYLKGGIRWDVVAWNRAMSAVFCDYARLPDGSRNMLWTMFLRPDHRDLYVDWEGEAARMVASFRAESASRLGDPAFAALVDELREQSPEFAAFWERRDLPAGDDHVKRLRHPALGDLEFESAHYEVTGRPGMWLVLYTPPPASRTEEVLRGFDLATFGTSPIRTPRSSYKRSLDALP